MAKRPLLNITAISGTIACLAIGIFFYTFNNSAAASVSNPAGIQPYFSHSISDIQPLNSRACDKIRAESEIDRWIQVDEYDGLELGRKIGDWVVSKIKDR